MNYKNIFRLFLAYQIPKHIMKAIKSQQVENIAVWILSLFQVEL